MLPKVVLVLLCLLGAAQASNAQELDSVTNKVLNFPSKLFNRIRGKTADLDQQLTKQTEKYLQKMAQQEARLKKQLGKTDSAGAARLFANSPQQYAAMLQKFKNDTATGKAIPFTGTYQPHADSLGTALRFLQQNPQFLSAAGKETSLVQGASTQMQDLQAKMQGSQEVQDFIQQRKATIKQYLGTLTQLPPGLNSAYQGMNTKMYYYSQQVQQYKDMLNNPDAMEKKALAVLSQTGAYQNFMKSNSQLAGLLGLPGNASNPATPQAALAGLETKDQMQKAVQGQIAPGGSAGTSALGSNIQSAESQLSALKDKLSRYGAGGENIESPNFTPNDQKTKSFLGRLEYGTNLQTSRTNYDFPSVTDFALTVGYRLGKQNSVGIGASYKLGWGNGINHIALTSQGVGLRSYLNIHVKGTWAATGGFEYNYETPFSSVKQIYNLDWWTKSGLIGVTKTVSIRSQVFKKTTLQLFWDFLSYQQVPRTQPIVFRVGYMF
jgi:hypothetical protein